MGLPLLVPELPGRVKLHRLDDNYEMIRMLGEGASAEVWLAWYKAHPAFQKKVAVKILHEVKGENAKRYMRHFINEARVGAAMQHPCVVSVFDFGVTEAKPWFAMEYIEGVTLRRLLSVMGGRSLGINVAVEIGYQIARALEYAHTWRGSEGQLQPVVHRDIKPENIIIGWTGEVKMLDYGIARWEGNRSYQTTASVPKGTPQYMSPEQIETPVSVGPRADLFALGTIILESLTGRNAFYGATIPVVLSKILDRQPIELFGQVRKENEELADLVEWLMKKAASARPASSSTVRSLLMELRVEYPLRRDIGRIVRDWMEELAGPDCAEIRSTDEFPAVRITQPDLLGIDWMDEALGTKLDL